MMPSKISEIKKPNIPGENMLIVIIIQDKKSKMKRKQRKRFPSTKSDKPGKGVMGPRRLNE